MQARLVLKLRECHLVARHELLRARQTTKPPFPLSGQPNVVPNIPVTISVSGDVLEADRGQVGRPRGYALHLPPLEHRKLDRAFPRPTRDSGQCEWALAFARQ